MKAIARQIRISSKKANLVAALVRNKTVVDAINILRYTTKKSAPVLKKVIESATANAENNFKQKRENLYIKEIVVTEGPTYKRSISVSRGRMHPILKRTCHITVKVAAGEAPEQKPKKTTKPEKNTESKKATAKITK